MAAAHAVLWVFLLSSACGSAGHSDQGNGGALASSAPTGANASAMPNAAPASGTPAVSSTPTASNSSPASSTPGTPQSPSPSLPVSPSPTPLSPATPAPNLLPAILGLNQAGVCIPIGSGLPAGSVAYGSCLSDSGGHCPAGFAVDDYASFSGPGPSCFSSYNPYTFGAIYNGAAATLLLGKSGTSSTVTTCQVIADPGVRCLPNTQAASTMPSGSCLPMGNSCPTGFAFTSSTAPLLGQSGMYCGYDYLPAGCYSGAALTNSIPSSL